MPIHRNPLPITTILAFVATGCGGPRCENKAFFGLPSPDTASIAFVFHRSCAAAGQVTTNVSVLDARSSLRNEPGNVLIVANEQPVRVTWLGPKRLLVAGFAEPTQQQSTHIASIAVEFQAQGQPDADRQK